MSSDWDRVTELLSQVTQAPAGERDAALRDCGYPEEVVEQVRRLLAAWESSPDFMDLQPETLEIVGTWRLLREIGRGGAGQVYEAVHLDPTDGRRVALKVIASGRMTPGQIEQFLQERALLAKLEHSGIARLYDTGRTPGGAPYFAMEFVEGAPLDRWFAENRPALRRRVEVFSRIVQALAYAHGRLVVHGDLKPANVLLTAEGEPRLLDFGAGRSLGNTDPGLWPMLTPEYASPEQLRGEPISAASDIYQVGVLLRRLILKESPDPEIEAIAARCLEAEPARRYGSADALQADLGAWLQHRPVSAVAPSFLYRARKFVRRNPTGALLALSLALGVAATGWQAWRAHLSSEQSLHRFEETRRVSRAMFQDIARLPVAARRPIVENLATLLNRTADPNETDPVVLLELAGAWRSLGAIQGLPNSPNLGDFAGAAQSYAKAIGLSERARQRDERAALEALTAYYAEAARVHADQSNKADGARFVRLLEESAVGLRRYGPSTALAYALGEIAYFRGGENRQAGIAAFPEAIAAFEAAGLSKAPALTAHLKRYGALLLAENRVEEGAVQYRRALAIERASGKDPFDMSYTLSDLSLAAFKLHRHREALDYCNEALTIRESAYRSDPNDVRVKVGVATSLGRMAGIHAEAGALDAAVSYSRRALQVREELAIKPGSPRHSIALGGARADLAWVLNMQDAKRHSSEIRTLVASIEELLVRSPDPGLTASLERLRAAIGATSRGK